MESGEKDITQKKETKHITCLSTIKFIHNVAIKLQNNKLQLSRKYSSNNISLKRKGIQEIFKLIHKQY